MRIRLVPIVCAVACGWPNYSNLPDGPDRAASGSLRAELAESMNITLLKEGEGDLLADLATNPQRFDKETLGLGDGLDLSAVLSGVGWNEADEAPTISDVLGDACAGESGSLATTADGTWSGDIDTLRIEVTESGVLCLWLEQDEPALGWDMVVYRLDACGLPTSSLEFEDATAGMGLGGVAGGHRLPVEPGNYGVLISGYSTPSGGELDDYGYRASISVVSGANGTEICPTFAPAAGQ
ncbi:MAG: hypothetical protein AB8H79_11540 [Myxococcota bacterium]